MKRKEEGTSSKTVTFTEESHVEVEPIEPRRKITRQFIICGKDASWFSLDKVWSF
jgi:hypothetical protein